MLDGLTTQQQSLVNTLRYLNDRINRLQEQISSGNALVRPSDAPDKVDQALKLEFQLKSTTQISQNLGRVQAELDTADGSLAQAAQLLDRAVTLASQGTSPLIGDSERQTMAVEADSLLQQMVNLSAAQADGRYIFSGDQDTVALYRYDASSSNPVMQQAEAEATRQIQDASGSQLAVSRTAHEIFDYSDASGTPLEGNVFEALRQLASSLRSGDQDAIGQALDLIRAASDHIAGQTSYYGVVLQRIQTAANAVESYQVQLQSSLSDLRDTDVPAAILEMTSAQNTRDAALSAESQRRRTSLFDYL